GFDTTEPIRQLRIEALTDDRLPNCGPGRVAHGNFVLSEIDVTVETRGGPPGGRPVKIDSAVADVEQNGFPAAAAIDGDLATGWAVHAGDRLNRDHAITVTFAEPAGLPGGARLNVTLRQQLGRHHTIGRLRLQIPSDRTGDSDAERAEIIDRRFG